MQNKEIKTKTNDSKKDEKSSTSLEIPTDTLKSKYYDFLNCLTKNNLTGKEIEERLSSIERSLLFILKEYEKYENKI